MFEGFTFDERAFSNEDGPHFSLWLRPGNATAITMGNMTVLPYHRANRFPLQMQIDHLTKRMSQHMLVDATNRYPGARRQTGRETQTITSILEEGLRLESSMSAEASHGVLTPVPSPPPLLAAPEAGLGDEKQQMAMLSNTDPAIAEHPSNPSSQDLRRLRYRRQLDKRLTNLPDNTIAIQTLMETMISMGSQCNVQGSSPNTPTSTMQSSPFCASPIARQDDSPDGPMVDTSLPLEVDVGYCEKDDKFSHSEVLRLRQGSGPGGVRKHGGIKYRSSSETALNCRNGSDHRLKKSIPRMRRRPAKKPQA